MLNNAPGELVITISGKKVRKTNSVKFEFDIAISFEKDPIVPKKPIFSFSFRQLMTLYWQYRRPLLTAIPHTIRLPFPSHIQDDIFVTKILKLPFPVLPIILRSSGDSFCGGEEESENI
jgi:hypothetical protein